MKKSLLIVSHALELGGAERSLIGLLDTLEPESWDIDLFLLRHEGELMDAIPTHVNLLPNVPAYTVLARPMKDTLREGHILLTSARLVGKIAARRYAKKHGHTDSTVSLEYSHKFTCPLMPKIQPEKEYDLAISFLTPHYFVSQKVRAKKRIAWIHTDYSRIQVNVLSETKMWSAYDRIASISEAVTESFLKVFPGLEDRIVLIENILPERLVRKQASAFPVEAEMCADGIRVLSIGRFSNAKNFDNVPWICKRILESGLDIKWYLIGYGGDEALIRQKIAEAGMQQHVIILGKKDNPYANYKALIQYILEHTDACVALIPHVVWAHNDDRLPLRQLYDAFDHNPRLILVEDHNAPELKYIISHCRIFVGARTHATIAAYSSCVPTLVVGYSVKARGIARDLFGTEEGYVLPVQTLKNENQLTDAFIWLSQRETTVRAHLKSILSAYLATSKAAIEAMKNLE